MTSELGQLISRHRGSFLAGGWGWYVGGILLLSSVAWLIGFFKALIAGDGNPLEQLVMMFFAVLVGLLFLIAPVLRLAQAVEVFEHGLVHRRPWGATTIRRDQVAAARRITHRSRGGAYEEVELELRDGGAISFTGIGGAEQIVAFARSWIGGGAPAPSPGGWTPPSSGGGWTPPSSGGGTPASSGGGWTPPSSGGGWTPPSSGGGWTPPS